MYKYGAEWIGIDIAENQIEQAKPEQSIKSLVRAFYDILLEEIF
jgi:hypothetical protein